MSRDEGDLDAAMAGLPDAELLRIVGVDREEYRSEALKVARAELGRRGVVIPEPAAARPLRERWAGVSILTKALLAGACLYTLAAKLAPKTSVAVRFSPSLGLGIVGAMLWSMAWDVRAKPGETDGVTYAERTWHKGLVVWASVVTLTAMYLAVQEWRS